MRPRFLPNGHEAEVSVVSTSQRGSVIVYRVISIYPQPRRIHDYDDDVFTLARFPEILPVVAKQKTGRRKKASRWEKTNEYEIVRSVVPCQPVREAVKTSCGIPCLIACKRIAPGTYPECIMYTRKKEKKNAKIKPKERKERRKKGTRGNKGIKGKKGEKGNKKKKRIHIERSNLIAQKILISTTVTPCN